MSALWALGEIGRKSQNRWHFKTCKSLFIEGSLLAIDERKTVIIISYACRDLILGYAK